MNIQGRGERGFTLIELLVVIAIIGLLSAVVLASLNSARAKGADAAVKSNLANIQTQAEVLYDNNNCYGTAASCNAAAFGPSTACNTALSVFVDPVVAQMISAAKSSGGTYSSCSGSINGGAWAAVVQLKTSNVAAWCIDSTGVKRQVVVVNSQAGLNAVISAAGACL